MNGLSPLERALLFAIALALVVLAGLPRPFTWPTYWDGSLGPMTQAIWLLENRFDYATLVERVPGYAFGGPKVYLFSIWPPLVALLMGIVDSPAAALAILHALNYAMAAGFVVVVVDLIRRKQPTLPIWAPSALILTLPFFLSQAAAVNMEMAMLLASALALRAYWTERFQACALWLLAGFAVKQSITPLALAFSAAFFIARVQSWRDLPRLVALAATPILAWMLNIIEMLISYRPLGDGVGFVTDRLFHPSSWFSWNFAMALRVPGLMALALTLVLLAVAALVVALRRSTPGWRASLEAPIFALASVGLLFLFNTLLRIPLARYVLSFWPALLVGLALLIRLDSRKLAAACAIWSVLQLSNLHGFWPHLFAGENDESFGNNGYILERSLECRDDIALQTQVFRTLEEKYADKTVVTTWPLLHHAMRPWYGYVKKGFPAMASHRPGMQWAGAQSFWEFLKANPDGRGRNPSDFIWVWTDNVFAFPPPPEKNREILESIEVGGRTATIFRYTAWPTIPDWAHPPVL